MSLRRIIWFLFLGLAQSKLAVAADTISYSGERCLEQAAQMAEVGIPSPLTIELSTAQNDRQKKLAEDKRYILQYLALHPEHPRALSDFLSDSVEVESIGAGGMGMAYRVKRPSGREYVIKVAKDPSLQYRIRNEAQVARKVYYRYPQGVPKVEYREDLGALKMDYIPGRDLHSLSRSKEYHDMPVEKKILLQREILLQLTKILDEIHRADVIHRDIKPANIMISGDMNDPASIRVKVIDFGVAWDRNESDYFSQPGTPEFMSWDAFRRRHTPWNDHFSLYMTVHDLLSSSDTIKPYTYKTHSTDDRKMITPWGTWNPDSVPQIAVNNPKLRAVMMLLRYAPVDGTQVDELPSLSDMMKNALQPSGNRNEEEFWRKFNLHVRARDPKTQALIYLGDDLLMEKGREQNPNFDRRLKERLGSVAMATREEWDVGRGNFSPDVPVIHDITRAGRTKMDPLIGKVDKLWRDFFRNDRGKTEVAHIVPTAEEKAKEKEARRFFYQMSAGIAASLMIGGGGVLWMYWPNPDDDKFLVPYLSELPQPRGKPKLSPVDEKAKKKEPKTP